MHVTGLHVSRRHLPRMHLSRRQLAAGGEECSGRGAHPIMLLMLHLLRMLH